MIRTALSIIILLLLSYGSVLLVHQPLSQKKVKKTVNDMIFDEIRIADYNKSGALDHEMTANQAYHDATQKIDIYTQPIITYYQKSQKPWILKSDKGHSNEKRDTLYFESNVIISQQASATQPKTEIKTDKLTYHVNSKSAETQSPVKIDQGTTQIKSIGAFINLESHLVKFFSKAEAFYG